MISSVILEDCCCSECGGLGDVHNNMYGHGNDRRLTDVSLIDCWMFGWNTIGSGWLLFGFCVASCSVMLMPISVCSVSNGDRLGMMTWGSCRQYLEKEKLFSSQVASLTSLVPTLQVHLVMALAFSSSMSKFEFLDLAYVSVIGRSFIHSNGLPCVLRSVCTMVTCSFVVQRSRIHDFTGFLYYVYGHYFSDSLEKSLYANTKNSPLNPLRYL